MRSNVSAARGGLKNLGGTKMKKKLLSLALALVLCLGLTVPAFAAEQKIVVNGEEYEQVLKAIMSEEEDKPVALKLESDVQLTATVVLGSSDYDGLFNGQTITVASHDVTVDLNGHTLTGEKDVPVFEVQKDYKLTIVDTSAEKAGKLVSQGETDVAVADGGEYVPLADAAEAPAEAEKPAGDEKEETPAETETPAAPKFTDVPATSPFAKAIDWAVAEGITTGKTETTFGPSDTCTVSHILTFLWRANGKPGAKEGVKDRDAALEWFEKEIVDNHGEPDAACTRSMAMLYIWQAAGNPETEAKVSFTDVASDAESAGAIAWAVENGVTAGTGDGTTFEPGVVCTRGQIVTFLFRANQAAAAPAEGEASK